MIDDTFAEGSPTPSSTLAEKLDLLFKTRHPAGRGEYTYEEVAEGIRQLGGSTIAVTQLWQLRTGKQTNPRKSQLEALATFFRVPVHYFFDDDDEETKRIQARLELLAAMRNNDVERIALRAADLSSDTLRAIAQIIENARHIEGLPNGGDQKPHPESSAASRTDKPDEEQRE
jgi:transcriptional regulator with XRE-family HTH domain